MLDDHHARLILDQFEAVIHQVLRSYQVDPRSADYPDYVQELRIKLLELAKNFDGQPLKLADDRYRFVYFAKQGLKWHLLNLFKKSPQEVSFMTDPVLIPDTSCPFSEKAEARISLDHYHQQARSHLNDREYWIYRALIDDQLSHQEIQDQLGIKRSTYYKYRQAIQRKLADFYPQIKQCVDTF